MHKSVEKLAYKISEAVQGNTLTTSTEKLNIYHRKVSTHNGVDVAYANGVATTGLRSAVFITSDKNPGNYNSFQSSLRQHLPLVINVEGQDANNRAYENLDCFVFVATNPQEHIYLNLLAYKVAELSLTPGIIIANYGKSEQKTTIPTDDLLKEFLGNADDYIECPTPSQKIIFGARRRRIPNWYSLDLPVMLGTRKENKAELYEKMAAENYFAGHLDEIIKTALEEFNQVFNLEFSIVSSHGKSGKNAIIANHNLVVDGYSDDLAKQCQLLKLNQIKPFPGRDIISLLGKTATITVAERTDLGGRHSYLALNLKDLVPNANYYFARIGNQLSQDTLESIIEHMKTNGSPDQYYTELQFTKSSSSYPKHEILLQEIGKQYPELKEVTIGGQSKKITKAQVKPIVPQSVRQHHDKGPNYSKLSGFYDNTAFFYQQNEEEELVADPFTALPVVPAGSAGFFGGNIESNTFPKFRPAKCTGCGECFVHCPHAALPPAVIGIEQLMRVGMDLATAKGNTLLKLTPMLKNLAKLAGKSIGEPTQSLNDFLPQAFDSLCKQMKLEEDNLETAQHEFKLVLNELASLPVSVTEVFFTKPESAEKGSGELFTLAINPATCTSCGICAEVCPEDAINLVDKDQEMLSNASEVFEIWEALPSTSETTLTNLEAEESYNKLAALLLPKDNYSSMTGGSTTESNNAYKTLIHLITAAANSIVLPQQKALIAQINILIESISDKVHESLSKALPRENLDALSKTLKENRSQKTSFHEIIDRLTEFEQDKLVDTRPLQRKTDLVDALKELSWVLQEGPTGVGRSPYSLYFSGSDKLSWAHQYPLNNFSSPAVVQWQGSAPEQILGLITGQVRHQIDNIKLIRRAEMEAAGKYDPAVHDLEIASLDWSKLTQDERKLISPVLVVGERDDINSAGWQSLNKLLAADLPVKVILLDHIAPPNSNSSQELAQSYAALLNVIVLKKAFVFQGSISNPEHLAKGLVDSLNAPKPALLNLYAFAEDNHEANETEALPYAGLAVNSRTFPLLYFNPDKEHGFLNGSIDVEANPESRKDWLEEDIDLPTGESIKYSITWADWAYTQKAWNSEFKKVSQENNNVVIAEYVKLTAKQRGNKIPVIIRASAKGLVYYSVSQNVVRMTEIVLENWNTLQELAGLITEFPTKLSEEVKKELEAKFEDELATLKMEYDQKLKDSEKQFTDKMRLQIRERLVQLSKMAKN